MGRRATFSSRQLVKQAVLLAAEGGPAAVTMKGVAAAAGAPSGSLYHRFDSRAALLAEVWRDALVKFQRDFWQHACEQQDAGEIAAITVRWARRQRRYAKILLLNAAIDFVVPACPAELQASIKEQQQVAARHMAVLAKRLLGSADAAAMERTVFAPCQRATGRHPTSTQARPSHHQTRRAAGPRGGAASDERPMT